jgi:hypothetical protein
VFDFVNQLTQAKRSREHSRFRNNKQIFMLMGREIIRCFVRCDYVGVAVFPRRSRNASQCVPLVAVRWGRGIATRFIAVRRNKKPPCPSGFLSANRGNYHCLFWGGRVFHSIALAGTRFLQ